MKPDPFEETLRRQPIKAMPAEWKDEILNAARAADAASQQQTEQHPASSRSDEPTFARLSTVCREWLWPHPVAWAGLAAVWLLIFSAGMIGNDAPARPDTAKSIMPQRGEAMLILVQHKQLWEELTETLRYRSRERKKVDKEILPWPSPRSQAGSRWMTI